jgi:hypothetical protein
MFANGLTPQKMAAQMLLAQLSAMTSIDEFVLLENKQFTKQLWNAGKAINSDETYDEQLSSLIKYIKNNF